MPNPTAIIYSTREDWLQAAHDLINDTIFTEHSIPTDAPVRVSCGFPINSRPGKSGKRTTLGTCHSRSSSADGHNEIFITPELADPEQVLAVLAHELLHAADDCEHGHKGPFAQWARAIGLEGPLTATTPGAALAELLSMIAQACGDYPHAEISTAAKKKQPTRMRKLECGDCGAVWRMSNKWAAQVECCPCCEGIDIARD